MTPNNARLNIDNEGSVRSIKLLEPSHGTGRIKLNNEKRWFSLSQVDEDTGEGLLLLESVSYGGDASLVDLDYKKEVIRDRMLCSMKSILQQLVRIWDEHQK